MTRGADPEGFEDFRGRLALGTVAFQEKAKSWVKKVTKEQPMRKSLESGVGIATIIRLVEDERGERWADFSGRHGDWGRELVMYLARKRSGLTLREIGDALGGVDYKTVSKALRRFEDSPARNRSRRGIVSAILEQMSKVET